MEFDELKATWRKSTPAAKTEAEIIAMLKENRHPVLKGMRQQLTIEVSGLSAFLICYYSMFDGAAKPAWLNGVFIASIALPLIHSVYGYILNRNVIHGQNIAASLGMLISKLRLYMNFAVIARLIFATGLCLFFGYGMELTAFTISCFIGLLLIFAVQLFLLYRIWVGRVRKLRVTLNELTRAE